MQDDPSKDEQYKQNDSWNDQKYVNKVIVKQFDSAGRPRKGMAFTANSLSGRERNRLFLRHNENFSDVTLVSGADDLADGRSFAVLDFDNDGWQDIALMSLNVPRFKLYRNQMGDVFKENKSIRFRLVGGQTGSEPSSEFSNRDAIGAQVLVTFESGNEVLMQNQMGEGFASQNSATMSIGVPKDDAVKHLKVRWPSGKVSLIESVKNDEVNTIREREN